MIKLPKDMTIKKEKVSPLYRVITVLAIYHLLIVFWFAAESFVTMENRFVALSFFEWSDLGRGMYLLFYLVLLPFMFDLTEEK